MDTGNTLDFILRFINCVSGPTSAERQSLIMQAGEGEVQEGDSELSYRRHSFAGTPSLGKNVEKDMGGAATGMAVEIEEAREDEVFKRRESLQRTPPELSKRTVGEEEESGKIMTTLESPMQAAYRDRANTLPKESIWKVQESLIRAGKRPREEEVVKGLEELSREIGRITNTITELAQITEASSKTKVEIKNTVKKLKRQANDLNREWKIISRREETNTVQPKEREMKSIGVQVDVKDIINEREEERLKMTNKIKTILEEKQNYESLAEVLDEKWPQELFKVTETVGGNQLDIKGDYAILMDPNNIEGNKLVDNLRLKYNGLDDLLKNSDEQVEFLIQTAKVKTKRNEYEENSCAVYFLPMSIDLKGVNRMEEVYEKMKDLRETAKIHPTESINLVVGEGLKVSYLQKICEHVFRKCSTKIRLILQGKKPEPQRHKTRKEEGIVTVKAEGKSYVDVLKKLKQEVDIQATGVKIKKLRKTGKGDHLLAVENESTWSDVGKVEDAKTRKIIQNNEWIKDKSEDVAVLFMNKKIEIISVRLKEGDIGLNFVGWDMYCCYISPNITLDKYMEKVDEIVNGVKSARVMDWQVLEEESLTEHRYISYVVKANKPPEGPSVMDWQVLEEESLTEHRYISYVVKANKPPDGPSEKRKYETDWNAFNANLKLRLANRTSKEICSYKMCANIIKEAYINSSKEGPKGEKTVPYWWGEEISAKRKECIISRRSLTKITKKCGNDEKKQQ
ncbi:hypothetical protein QE152_g39114 [Popillia japonica]|uniref:Uncharacterized protein n=1 Tax=Popillia japonica TaxID=7064 RepID=A0AAW1HVF0_POPJA